MKKTLFVLPIVSLLMLSGCAQSENNKENENQQNDEDLKEGKNILSPAGAPVLPLYDLVLNDRVEIEKDTTLIPGQLSKGDYDYIVFDSTNAAKLLKKQGDNAKYEFAKMLTGGNFHLFGFDKKEGDIPVEDDYIVGFNEAATPGKMFHYLYNDVSFDENFNGVTLVRDAIISNFIKQDGAKEIDWAILAEPVATAISAQLKAKEVSFIDIDMQKEFKNKNNEWDKDYICQAGLFVNKEYKAANPKKVESTLNAISESINKLFTDFDSIESEITAKLDTDEKQTNTLGFAFKAVKAAQGQNSQKNGIGVVPNDISFTIHDIDKFNEILG